MISVKEALYYFIIYYSLYYSELSILAKLSNEMIIISYKVKQSFKKVKLNT